MDERRPNIDERGVPYCTDEDCPSYDGKRCRATGYRPGLLCEPHVADMAVAREHTVRSIARLRGHKSFSALLSAGNDAPGVVGKLFTEVIAPTAIHEADPFKTLDEAIDWFRTKTKQLQAENEALREQLRELAAERMVDGQQARDFIRECPRPGRLEDRHVTD